MTRRTWLPLVVLIAACLLPAGVASADLGLKAGSVELKSVGPLAFGPGGVLLISDPKAATIYAVATNESADAAKGEVNVPGINGKIASMLGTSASNVRIVDMAANPITGTVYLAVTRSGKPIVMRVTLAGKISEFALSNVRMSSASIPNAPEDKTTGSGRRQRNNRLFSVTDLAYVDGRVIIAGLSNEQFASNLREVPFPFKELHGGTAIEIYHGAHGKYETRSPVRTFVPIDLAGDPQIIAAYTCTPLVRIPLADLQPGKKVRGTTVAELGNRNRPLDIIAYKKGGQGFLLMANSSRGVMKIPTKGLDTQKHIETRVSGKAGQEYETIASLTNVTQLDKLNNDHAVILVEADGNADLKTVALP